MARTPTPNVAQWIWHAHGGKLPQRYREWVLHDATARTWFPRYVVGMLIRMIIPLALVYLLLASFGGQTWLILLSLLLGLISALYYSLTYAQENVDSRLLRYGYPQHEASRIRHEADAEKTAAQRARYNAKWRATEE
jgi:hypothetical protein